MAGQKLTLLNAGRTALHIAAASGALGAVNALLDAGASIDARNSYGTTPIFVAAKGSHIHIVETLVRRGAAYDLTNNGGWTPLHYGRQAVVNSARIVELLLANGARDTPAPTTYRLSDVRPHPASVTPVAYR